MHYISLDNVGSCNPVWADTEKRMGMGNEGEVGGIRIPIASAAAASECERVLVRGASELAEFPHNFELLATSQFLRQPVYFASNNIPRQTLCANIVSLSLPPGICTLYID